MPPIFKALVTISVWVLFIVGCFATITTGIAMAMGTPDEMSMAAVFNGIGGIVAFILVGVAAWLRKKLE
jgi:hypothetical protein